MKILLFSNNVKKVLNLKQFSILIIYVIIFPNFYFFDITKLYFLFEFRNPICPVISQLNLINQKDARLK